MDKAFVTLCIVFTTGSIFGIGILISIIGRKAIETMTKFDKFMDNFPVNK